jgi:hypothetical protein
MRPTERCEIVATTPRRTAWRASSLWLQCVIGSPLDTVTPLSCVLWTMLMCVYRAEYW